MPWCASCSKSLEESEAGGSGRCPTCDATLEETPRAPWHFKLMVVALSLYLGWRAWQGIGWLLAHL